MIAFSKLAFASRLSLTALVVVCSLCSATCYRLWAQPPLSDLDRELLDDLTPPETPGEDVGDGPTDSRAGDALNRELGRLSAEMRRVGERLRADVAAPETPSPQTALNEARSRQDRLAVDLAKLIADLERQSPRNSAATSSSAASSQSSSQAAVQATPKPAGKDDNAAGQADEAGDESGGDGAGSASTPDLKANIWGHLPQRWRSQMATGAAVEFLPRYREAIEDYYRRLAKTNSPE